MSLNVCMLQGRLGRDPELRFTPDGLAVATVSIAVSRDFQKEDGERGTDWISIIAWKNTAEFLANHFKKGQMILVKGRLQERSYTTQNGEKRHKTEVLAERLYFSGDAKKDAEENNTDFSCGLNENDLPF